MMRRSDFLKVGGFGLEWEPAYYEDTDLCLKFWTQCGKVMVNPNARVIHIESKTTSDSRLKLHDISEINRARFVKKWGPWLEARQTAPLANLALAPRPEIAERGTADLDLRVANRRLGLTVRALLAVSARAGRRGADVVRAGLGSFRVAGTANVVFASPDRYSSIRIRQIEATFGFDNVIGTALPWDMVEPASCRFAAVIGNSIVPAVPPFGKRSVYHIQFPFWMPDRVIEEHGHLLAGYDEIWAYSDFVRRQRQRPHPPLRPRRPAGTADPPHAMWSGAVGGLPWSDRRTILTVGRFFAGGHNKRQDVVIEAFRRCSRTASRAWSWPWPVRSTRALKAGTGSMSCSVWRVAFPAPSTPMSGAADLAALYGRSAVLIHAAGFGVDADEFPETARALRDHPDRGGELRLYPGGLRAGWPPGSGAHARLRDDVRHRRRVCRDRVAAPRIPRARPG